MRSKAFTLAEVLITLGVIGIVAALTLPSLIAKQHERSYITALKKAYSTLSQAYQFVVTEYGNPEEWSIESFTSQDGEYSGGSADLVMNNFAKYMKYTKLCTASDKNCLKLPPQRYLNNKADAYNFRNGMFSSIVLSDGAIIHFYASNNNCNTILNANENLKLCGNFYVDVNGFRKPNKRGVDFFELLLTNKGIIPNGIPDKSAGQSLTFDKSCADAKTMLGLGCGAWVLTHDNMDYLHCNDLSWTGKNKCK